jgi:hypothetical protein
MGFEEPSDLTHPPPPNLMRMLGAKGNPQACNLFDVIAHFGGTRNSSSPKA